MLTCGKCSGELQGFVGFDAATGEQRCHTCLFVGPYDNLMMLREVETKLKTGATRVIRIVAVNNEVAFRLALEQLSADERMFEYQCARPIPN